MGNDFIKIPECVTGDYKTFLEEYNKSMKRIKNRNAIGFQSESNYEDCYILVIECATDIYSTLFDLIEDINEYALLRPCMKLLPGTVIFRTNRAVLAARFEDITPGFYEHDLKAMIDTTLRLAKE